MPMNAEKRRLPAVAGLVGLGLVGLGLAVGLSAYFAALHLTAPQTVPITLTGCQGAGEARVEIPLEALEKGTSTIPISFGPIHLPGAGGAIRLRFHPALSLLEDGRVLRSGDMVNLPLTFGLDRTLPARIDLKCVDGSLTGIRYRHESASRMFRVVNDPEATPD
jgi:hypothetical protein